MGAARLWMCLALLAAVLYPARGRAAGDEPTVTLAAVGDILLDRGVRNAMERRGADAIFAEVAPVLQRADLAVGNLECPLTARREPRPMRYVFRCDPERAATLRAAGFDILSLANNHSLDQGRGGLRDTLAALRAAGLAPVGAGEDAAAAQAPVILERNGLRIAFLSFLDMPIEGALPLKDRPGVAMADADAVAGAVAAARVRADVVVVQFHWGVEFSNIPVRAQRDLACTAAAAGADLIIGHHPHVLQPYEWMGRTLVVYSLGNFVFDQHSRRSASESAILVATLSRQGVREFSFEPVVILDGRPSPATPPAATSILGVLSGIKSYGIFE